MPGPLLNTPILDLFQRANVGPPPGSDFLNTLRSGDNGFRIVGNVIVPNATGPSGVCWNAIFARRQEVFVKLAARPAPDKNFEIYTNVTTPGSTSTGYYARFWHYAGGNGDGNVDIWRMDGAGGDVNLTFGGGHLDPGDEIGFVNDNGTLRVYKNGVQVTSWVDNTYTNAGYIGLRSWSDDTLIQFDEFGGGDGVTFKQFFGFQPATQSLPYTAEGGSWAFTAGGATGLTGTLDATSAYESSNDTGAGLGGLRARRSGRNLIDGAPYWEWTGTWEQLGLPVGAVITQVSLDHDWAQPEYTTGAAGVIGPSELRDGAGTLQATIQASGATPAAAQSTWTKRTGTAQAVPSALQPSNSTIKLRINVIPKTGNNVSAAESIGIDNVAVTVTYSYTPGQAETQNVNDAITLTDTIVLSQGKVIADSITLSDARTFDQGKALADSLTLTDVRTFEQSKLLEDLLWLDDIPVVETGKIVSLADTLDLADALTFDRSIFLAETLPIADSLAFQSSVYLALADALSLSDALTFDQVKFIADTMSLVDSISVNRGLVQTLADTLPLLDSSIRETGKGVSLADTLALADSLAFVSNRELTITDTLPLADALAFQRSVYLSLADTLPLADGLIFARGLTLADALPLTDAFTFSRGLTLSDTLALVDAVGLVGLNKQLTLSDTLSLVDATSRSLGKELELADILPIADALAFQRSVYLALVDALELSDTAGLTMGKNLMLADVLSLADSILVSKKVAGVVLNEASALYLGGQVILASYLGDKLVWPEGE